MIIRQLQQTTLAIFVFFTCLILIPKDGRTQCHDWSIQANIISTSLCAANGSFNVVVSGPDAGNLTNLQYGIPLGASGFSVPLNSSPTFANIPPDVFQVSVVASCGGTLVGKNTTITMPGSYIAPTSVTSPGKGSLSCAKTGSIYVSVFNGVPPFTSTLTSYPSNYTGPLTVSASGYMSFTSLPPGTYITQTIDACGTGTIPGTTTVSSLDPTTIALDLSMPVALGCDSIVVPKPRVQTMGTGWGGYDGDTSFKVSVQISGGLSVATPFEAMDNGGFVIKLPAGKTLKDCYGKVITYTIKPPCGPNFTRTSYIPFTFGSAGYSQNCNVSITPNMYFTGLVCFPVTYTMRNTATNVLYGPYSTNGALNFTPPIPLGSYTYNYTTGDGYTGSGSFGATPITGNPYSVRVLPGSNGLNNFIDGFEFTTTNANLGTRTVELFNGPAGYYYTGGWATGTPYQAYSNQTPVTGTLKFIPGNYVWKVTDRCGSYLLPITVTANDIYQYTISIRDSQQTCNGKLIWPIGTATSNGVSMPFKYSVLFNNSPYLNSAGIWQVFNSNDPFMTRLPGVYTIIPYSVPTVFTGLSYPNIYTNSISYNYRIPGATVDINKTQGFLCLGANNTDGKIFVTGMGGVPFQLPTPHYKYFLGNQGQGAAGIFFANNTTGVFTGFGATANAIYDVKVMDSCGSFSIQEIKILDLRNARLISSSNYVACANDSVMMSAIYLPNATYSWTGPNGFSSNQRNPVVYNVGPSNIGVYKVVITTTECATVIRDSTLLTMNGNPPKPLISLTCNPLPPVIKITNPQAPLYYEWRLGFTIGSNANYYSFNEPSDTLHLKYVYTRASYRAVAVDTTTGCRSESDSIYFSGNPRDTLRVSIYSPHLRVCTGDTTILLARGGNNAISYQWFRNSAVIPGATTSFYATSIPGNYKVRVQTGPCHIDTSDEVTVVVVPLPVANITAPVTQMCAGDTLKIYADTAAGYIYNWLRNGSSIPGAFSSVLDVTEGGSYSLIVSNGGCARNSIPINIIKHAGPIITLAPATDQYICAGDSVRFSTYNDPGYSFLWERDGLLITGANGSSYTARSQGVYRVYVGNAQCPKVPSVMVSVNVLTPAINLGNDTVICAPGPFSIPLSIDATYTDVLWSTGATTPFIDITQRGTYWVRGKNMCGVYADTIRVGSFEEYAINLPSDTLVCNADNRVVVSVPARLQQVLWSNGANTTHLAITSPGTYWVTGHSPCGMITDTINVRFCKPEVHSVTVPQDGICEGECIQPIAVTSNYPQTYKWSFPGGLPDSSNMTLPGNICYPKAGTYPIRLEIANAGGMSIFNSSITVNPRPVPRFRDSSVVLSYGKQMILPTCANDALKTSWYRDGQLVCENCASITVEGKYYLSTYTCVVSNGTCFDSCMYKMKVIDIPHDIWLPDAFTPNGDGRNDVFRIITDNPNVYAVNLFVYNRWGQQLHVSHSATDGWDGTMNGKASETGTYFWMLRYKVLGSDEVFFKKGDLQLIR